MSRRLHSADNPVGGAHGQIQKVPREEDAAQVAPSPRSLFVAQLRQDIIRAQDTKTITLLEARWLLYVLDTTM